MLLIIEIALAVAAWRRGWKGRALLRFTFGLPGMFVAGVVAGAAGAGNDSLTAIGLLGELAIVGVLAYMVRRPRAMSSGSLSRVVPCAAETNNQ